MPIFFYLHHLFQFSNSEMKQQQNSVYESSRYQRQTQVKSSQTSYAQVVAVKSATLILVARGLQYHTVWTIDFDMGFFPPSNSYFKLALNKVFISTSKKIYISFISVIFTSGQIAGKWLKQLRKRIYCSINQNVHQTAHMLFFLSWGETHIEGWCHTSAARQLLVL